MCSLFLNFLSSHFRFPRMEELRRRFEPPNDSNRWDNPLFKVKMFHADDCTTASNATTDNNQSEPSSAANEVKATKKSSWKPKKKTTEPTTDNDTTITKNPDVQKPTADDSQGLSFSGSLVTASEELAAFEEYSVALEKIFDHLSNATAPLPNSSTVVHQHADADLLYELDRTSQKIVQVIMSHQAENIEGTPVKFVEYDRAITLHRPVTLAELQRYKNQYVKINAQHPPNTSKAIGSSFIDFLAAQL
jgi:tRNA uridine 5-carbamoylmethylation protein Kti12